MEFTITNPELAFVRFEVWDIDPIGRDFIGQRTIFLNCMASGNQLQILNPILRRRFDQGISPGRGGNQKPW